MGSMIDAIRVDPAKQLVGLGHGTVDIALEAERLGQLHSEGGLT